MSVEDMALAFETAVPSQWSVTSERPRGHSGPVFYATSPNRRWQLKAGGDTPSGEWVVELSRLRSNGEAEYVDSRNSSTPATMQGRVHKLISENVNKAGTRGYGANERRGSVGGLFKELGF